MLLQPITLPFSKSTLKPSVYTLSKIKPDLNLDEKLLVCTSTDEFMN